MPRVEVSNASGSNTVISSIHRWIRVIKDRLVEWLNESVDHQSVAVFSKLLNCQWLRKFCNRSFSVHVIIGLLYSFSKKSRDSWKHCWRIFLLSEYKKVRNLYMFFWAVICRFISARRKSYGDDILMDKILTQCLSKILEWNERCLRTAYIGFLRRRVEILERIVSCSHLEVDRHSYLE